MPALTAGRRAPHDRFVHRPSASLLFVGLFVLGAWAVPSSARADLPPPDDYVEQCTVDQAQARTKQACQSCSAWHGEADACKKQFAGGTFAHECRSYGASTWSEVWCDPKQALAPEALAAVKEEPAANGDDPPPSAGSSRGCAVARGDAPLGLAWGLLLVGLLRTTRGSRGSGPSPSCRCTYRAR